MVICSVTTCKNRSHTTNFSKDGVSYHTFPKHPILRQEWVKFCRRTEFWTPKRTSKICSKHFDPTSYQHFPDMRKKLKEYAKPTIFNINDSEETKTTKNSSDRNDNTQSLHKLEEALEESTGNVYVIQQPTASEPMPASSEQMPCAKPIPSFYAIQPLQTMSFPQPIVIGQIMTFSQTMPIPEPMLPTQPMTPSEVKREIESPHTLFLPEMHSPTLSSSGSQPKLPETPRIQKLKKQLEFKNKKIKRLQSKNSYLTKKVDNLKELLDGLNDKFISMRQKRMKYTRNMRKNSSIRKIITTKVVTKG